MSIQQFRLSGAVGCVVAALLAGCAGPAPEMDVSGGAAQLAGLADPIEFRAEGEPIDCPAPSSNSELRLVDAVKRAMTQSPTVQAAMSRVRIAEADAHQARLLPNPILSIAIRYPEGGGKPVIDPGLAADLVFILQTPDRARAADNRLRLAAAEALSLVLDELLDVQETYALAQSLEEQKTVLEARREVIQRMLGIAQARVKGGEASKLDVVTLDAHRLELETEIDAARLERRQARLKLTRLIGEPSAPATWSLVPLEPTTMPTSREEEWIAAALTGRPQIQARLWELAALGDESALARWSLFNGASVGAIAERDGHWSAGPAVSVPLPFFDWGQARAEKVTAQQIEARHKLVDAQRIAIEEARRGYAALTESIAVLQRVRLELIPLQEQRRALAEAAYRAGESDLATLLLAEEDLQTARSKRVELKKQAVIAHFRLEHAAGGAAAASGVKPATRPSAAP